MAARRIENIAILGTGLIGGSVGLALRRTGFAGRIVGWDRDRGQAEIAQERGAIGAVADDAFSAARQSDVIVLAGPVFSILEWMERLAPELTADQLVTDVGSVKSVVSQRAREWYGRPGRAAFLPGHPMSGKEVSGAANADAGLFDGAVWLFTPVGETAGAAAAALMEAWRLLVAGMGCRVLDLDAERHDELCAWVSHLPQMVSTAMSALLEDRFAGDADLRAIGGRALGEMTRLGASPYSMWRDIAHLNTEAIAESLLALEQRLAHVRENLRTPELREEFEQANRFRLGVREKGRNS